MKIARLLGFAALVWLTACAPAPPPASQVVVRVEGSPQTSPGPANPGPRKQLNSPTAKNLLRELDTWDAEVEISERTDPSMGLGDSVVKVEGTPVWPPAGTACLGLVQCCEQLAGMDPVFGLLCQFSIAKDGNCTRGLQTLNTIVAEAQIQAPPACGSR